MHIARNILFRQGDRIMLEIKMVKVCL